MYKLFLFKHDKIKKINTTNKYKLRHVVNVFFFFVECVSMFVDGEIMSFCSNSRLNVHVVTK